MCDTCGCSQPGQEPQITRPGNDHNHHSHNHAHSHEHTHADGTTHSHPHHHHHAHQQHGDHLHHPHEDANGHNHSHDHEIIVEQDVLGKNNLMAERNRGYFEAKNIFSINLVSSPGSGKTSLLERTISDLKEKHKFYVVEGDQQTMNDANRIDATGADVVQVNTGNGCHLDSDMINRAIKELNPEEKSVFVIENVGNLVCPSMFDLGENKRVVIISVTEGEDKPIKYPNMFESSDICIINKTDLLPYVDFDVEKAKQYALQVNHHLEFFELSVKTGEGIDKWYEWLQTNAK